MIRKIKNIIKTMGIYHGARYIFHIFKMKVFSFNLFEDFYHYQSYKYLEKFYRDFKSFNPKLSAKNLDFPKKCWIMWWQGEENAPEIVKRTLQSIRKNINEFEIILLTEENLLDYVDLPERIFKLFSTKRMSFAHFSDIVRTYLLYFYGGLWIDATCFLTDKVPNFILDSDLFFFQDTVASVTFLPISNWFIYSNNPNNYVLEKLLYGLIFYWNKKSTICDYFLYHVLFKYFMETDNKFKINVDKMPYYCNSEPHVLQKNLFTMFNQEKWNLFLSSSFCHKLTYKYTQEREKDTFIDYILLNKEV